LPRRKTKETNRRTERNNRESTMRKEQFTENEIVWKWFERWEKRRKEWTIPTTVLTNLTVCSSRVRFVRQLLYNVKQSEITFHLCALFRSTERVCLMVMKGSVDIHLQSQRWAGRDSRISGSNMLDFTPSQLSNIQDKDYFPIRNRVLSISVHWE
jgi:hypothetical protein